MFLLFGNGHGHGGGSGRRRRMIGVAVVGGGRQGRRRRIIGLGLFWNAPRRGTEPIVAFIAVIHDG